MKTTDQVTSFQKKLAWCKKIIDQDVEDYSRNLLADTTEQFGERSALAAEAFTSILGRGGKRIRGALAMVGYEMSGGKDTEIALVAARVVEMMHAYTLMIDDIQDRSVTRRGGDAAHIIIQKQHEKLHLAGDSAHFGISLALNGALFGVHNAQMVLGNIEVETSYKFAASQIINRTMMITAHGQTNDIYNEATADVDENDIKNVLNWKTAQYTFIGPLQAGMALAGASEVQREQVVGYGKAAGFAFQITDDIMGIFGEEAKTGKSQMDDIKEGKRTLLVAYALEHADNAGKNFLISQLGNEHITLAQFERVKEVILQTGALDYAKNEAQEYVQQALNCLDNIEIQDDHQEFLGGLARALIDRKN